MKKLFAFIIASMIATAGFSQKIDGTQVPDAVQKTFKSRFANVNDAKWEKEDSLYSAEFLMDASKTEATFSDKGAWINTEWEFPIEYAPQSIKDYITKNYDGYKLKEISVSEFPVDGKLYVAEIMKKKECQKVYFTLKNEFKKDEKMVCGKDSKCCKKGKKCEKKD
jgi:hypothetical protein